MTSVGKSTAAMKLGEELGLPVLHADQVLNDIAEGLMFMKPEKLALREFEAEFSPLAVKLLKINAFQKLFADISGDFIIEGFTLGYKYERRIINKVLGEHRRVMLHIKPPYERWEKLALKKGYHPTSANYKLWQGYFQPTDPDYTVYTLTAPEQVAIHYEPYQRSELTDVKWPLLGLTRAELKGKTVLDLGCNDGWIGGYCINNGAAEVTGVDLNWRNLENAKGRGIKPKLRDFNDPEWANDLPQHDIALSLAMLHYVVDKEKFIATCAKLTRNLFVLELPISVGGGSGWEKYHEKYKIPSEDIITDLLKNYFKYVEKGNRTPAPDNTSTRFVFKARHAYE